MKLIIWAIAAVASLSVTLGFEVHPVPAFFVGTGFGLMAWRICDIIE